MSFLKPNDQRAKLAIAMIWIAFSVNLMALISDFFQYQLIQNFQNGADVSEIEISSNDSRQQLISILNVLVVIVCAVTFIQWFRRAYYNLHERAVVLSYTEGWAAGSWFIPFINWVRPYRIMTELYTETEKILLQKSPGYANKLNTSWIGIWWGLWIGYSFISNISGRMSLRAETIAEIQNGTIANMIACLICIPAALAAIKVIRDYAAIEPLFFNLSEVVVLPSDPLDLIEAQIQNQSL